MSRRETNLPPREPGRFLVGNTDFKPEIPIVLKLWQKHGDLFTLKIFGKTLVVACGYQTLSDLLEKNGESSREHPPGYNYNEIWQRTGFFGAFGQVSSRQRKFAHDTLKEIDSGDSDIESHVVTEVSHFIKEVENAEGQPFDIKELIKTSHYNIASSLFFGERFEYSDPDLKHLTEFVYEATMIVPDHAMLAFFECLKYLPGDKFKIKRKRYLIGEILKIVQKAVDGHKNIPEKSNSTDFIYSFLKEQERRKQIGEDLEGFKDRDLLFMGYGFLFGGIGVIEALDWAVLYLMHHQEVVSRMQEEIAQNIESSHSPTLADRPNLPYCHAVVYEVLRTASIICVAPSHILSSSVTINDYTIPENTWILLALCTVNMDPSIFPEPDKFKPDRFINSDGQLFGYEKIKACFSLGPRNCLGQHIAEMEMFLVITALVQKFDIRKDENNPLPSLEGVYKGARLASPYKVCLKKRL
ncbi:cytochrome P450 2B9-like [Saccostrea echinata]|uniref:cytochrome P450 2B9-like n=1 Tax=Saccostrea echinata TaxID=191078 RepID=UPI002A836F22|nr:cytochrome P450 2B9-like [Saccostrea echinata]